MKKTNEKKELMELKHDPIPGYKPVFLIVFGLSVLYLAIVFAKTWT